MGQYVKVSKTVNDTVERTLQKVVSAIRTLDFKLETVDSRNGTVRFTKHIPLSSNDYKYQCVVFDMGDGSTLCTIQTVEYVGGYPWWGWLDSIGFLVPNSRKFSKQILDSL